MLCRSERRSMALDDRTELSISARGLEATIEQLLLKGCRKIPWYKSGVQRGHACLVMDFTRMWRIVRKLIAALTHDRKRSSRGEGHDIRGSFIFTYISKSRDQVLTSLQAYEALRSEWGILSLDYIRCWYKQAAALPSQNIGRPGVFNTDVHLSTLHSHA